MKSGIYRIRHVSGRVYIGSSAGVRRRLYVHRYLLERGTHDNIHLQRIWNRDGPGAFEFELVEVVADPVQLLVREQHWIDAVGACDPLRGFNIAPIAGSRAGVPQPPSVAAKLREVHLGKPKSAETRAKMSAGNTGKVRTEEMRQLQSESAKVRMVDPARRAALSEALKGKPSLFRGRAHTDEARANMSAARAAWAQTPEGRAHIEPLAELQRGKKISEETRRKLSATHTGKPRPDPRSPSPEALERWVVARRAGDTFAKIAAREGVNPATVHKYVSPLVDFTDPRSPSPEEVDRWVALKRAGGSYGDISKATGRSTKVIHSYVSPRLK